MPKYPTSNKTTSFVKPRIKKGYYPAKLISAQPYLDKDKHPVVGKWGKQLILEFAIYKPNDLGAPIDTMKYAPVMESPSELEDVVIAKFVYHQYRSKSNAEEFQTAFTPNSAVTKIFEALGWQFSPEGIDTDDYIGNWVELNVDDYEYEDDKVSKVASTIKDISPYKGPEIVDGQVKDVVKKEPKKVEKQVKHEAVPVDETNPDVQEKRAKIVQLEQLCKDGLLTKEGLAQAKEQIEAQIQEVMRKK